ncbi:MAG: hypothetical protein ACKOCV_00365, partial [Gemmatimonadota bacterium]
MRPLSLTIPRPMHLRGWSLALGLLAHATACRTAEVAPPLALEALTSPVAGDAAEPFVATAPDGRVTLSWLAKEADSTTALRFATWDPTTGAWSAPQEVVRRRDLFVNWADFPSLVTLSDGTLLAHWLQRNGGGRVHYDVHLAASRDRGATWGPSSLPHPEGVAAEHGLVSVLPDAAGGADVTLHDGSAGALAPPGPHGPPPLPVQFGVARGGEGGGVSRALADSSVCDCCQTALARTTRGLVAVYRDRSAEGIRDMAVIRHV